jgi:hypothetical protein
LPKVEPALSVCRQHLDDRDAECRFEAACGVWFLAKDPQIKAVFVQEVQDRKSMFRFRAAQALVGVSETDPDLFPLMAALAEDSNPNVLLQGMLSVQFFGKRGVPLLRKWLRDPAAPWPVLFGASDAASRLGKDGVELIPDLVAIQNHPHPSVSRAVAHGLYRMDPKQFAKPTDWVD